MRKIILYFYLLILSLLLTSCTHSVRSYFPNSLSTNNTNQTEQPHHLPTHIGLLLPLQGSAGIAGNTIRDGFLSAYYSATATGAKPALSFYDTANGQSVIQLYQKAATDGADFIIGPLTKPEVNQLSHSTISIRTLALNYTDNALPPHFFEFGLSPETEIIELAQHVHTMGYTQALIIAPESPWGHRMVKTLNDQWQKAGGQTTDILFFTQQEKLSDDIARFLQVKQTIPDEDKDKDKDKDKDIPIQQKRRQDFNVIFLLATPADARQIMPLLRYDYLLNVPVFATSTIYSGKPDPAVDNDLNGVHFCETSWILHAATLRPSNANQSYFSRLYAVGRDSWLIMTHLNSLIANPAFTLAGDTGTLTLLPDQRIYRHLVWAEFINGYATPVVR